MYFQRYWLSEENIELDPKKMEKVKNLMKK